MRITPAIATIMAGLWAGFVIADDSAGFVEEFETLDEGRWYVSDGWTNGPHQNCTWSRDAVQV